jgi:adenosylcobinamide-GDP ribazoletransferase
VGLLWAPLAAVAVAGVLTRIAARRLGGTTGDVLGATCELATTAALLVMVL